MRGLWPEGPSGVAQTLRQLQRLSQLVRRLLTFPAVPRVPSPLYNRLELIWETLLRRYEQLAAGVDRLGELPARGGPL